MFGICLLLLSLFLYFRPKYRYISYFIYLSFMLGHGGGFGLWTDSVTGMKNTDCAIVYTITINLYLLLNKKWHLPDLSFKRAYYVFLIFLGCSVLFSLLYYRLTPFQILQGGRRFFLIFSLPILIRATPVEVEKLVKMLIGMCIITSILYILQILVFRRPIMPYSLEVSEKDVAGLPRMYNFPANLNFFLALSLLFPQYLPRLLNAKFVRVILFVTLLCTLGRTMIFLGLFFPIFVSAINGDAKKVMKIVLIFAVMILPFIGIIADRFDEGGTSNDLSMIASGDFGEDYNHESGATMLYRLAWCYERAAYLIDRPLGEQVFGMGFCSDSQDWVRKRYNFQIGLIDKEQNEITQLGTPDIAYGNMITKLGFVGMVIYLFLCIRIAQYFWKHRKCNPLYLLMTADIVLLFFESFAGSNLSETKSLCFMFLIVSLAYHKGTGIYQFRAESLSESRR